MPTVIVEDGSIVAGASSYASRATGDAYADTRLYATAWTSATGDDKDRALIMATRVIDQEIQFNGYKVDQLQSLQWPRRQCPDPDSTDISVFSSSSGTVGPYLPDDQVPKAIVDATCEMAIQLLTSNRTGDAEGQGIKRVDLAGALEVEFFGGSTAAQLLTRDVLNMLAKYGRAIGSTSAVVKLQRV